MKGFRAIIFDFDGVIVESVEAKGRIFAQLFRDYPGHVEEIVGYHLAHGGLSRFQKFEYIHREILGEPLTDERLRSLSEAFSRVSLEVMSECPYVPGAKEFVKRHAASLLLFIVSGAPQDEICEVVVRRGLAGCFRGVYGTPIGKIEHAATVLRRFGLSPDEVCFVGDSIEDYRGASENRIAFVARVRDGEADVFKGCRVAARVRDMVELDAYLGTCGAHAS